MNRDVVVLGELQHLLLCLIPGALFLALQCFLGDGHTVGAAARTASAALGFNEHNLRGDFLKQFLLHGGLEGDSGDLIGTDVHSHRLLVSHAQHEFCFIKQDIRLWHIDSSISIHKYSPASKATAGDVTSY